MLMFYRSSLFLHCFKYLIQCNKTVRMLKECLFFLFIRIEFEIVKSIANDYCCYTAGAIASCAEVNAEAIITIVEWNQQKKISSVVNKMYLGFY